MLPIILALVIIVILLFVVLIGQPDAFTVLRSATIAVPPAAVFQQVNDFHKWEAWSPWAKLDPAMKVDHAGPESGVGAVYHWKGNDKVGEGRMTITGAVPDKAVQIKLEFLKPWEQTSLTEFTFAPDPGGTRVTWSMSGQHDFVGKLFAVFMDMDGMVGPDFEKGLKALKEQSRE